MSEVLQLSASQEDYIEAIFNIVAENRVARAKDIAATLGVAPPSVTGALKSLAAKGLINYDPYSLVTLTPAGEKAARRVVRRHDALARFLVGILGIDPESAGKSACRLEHSLGPEVLNRLNSLVDFVDSCPLAGERFREQFRHFFNSGACETECVDCGKKALASARRLQGPKGGNT